MLVVAAPVVASPVLVELALPDAPLDPVLVPELVDISTAVDPSLVTPSPVASSIPEAQPPEHNAASASQPRAVLDTFTTCIIRQLCARDDARSERPLSAAARPSG